jgi:DNA-binding NtrC family response regulator
MLAEYGLLEDDRGLIVGRSIRLLQTLALARRGATGKGNILLLGESGTGKELLARYIHDKSPKARGPYRVFHAFGTAEPLQEDELFGHVRGAFTDAKTERAGLFEEASGGTLFIDEIGDISEVVQNKLMRPIEMRHVRRQGGNREKAVDVQLVLATNKQLDKHVATGLFKSDFLHRIDAFSITLPPLRDRREDIRILTERLLETLCHENAARWPRDIAPDAECALVTHDWRDGNIRELRNVLERMVKNNKDAEIVLADDIRFDASLARRSDVAHASKALATNVDTAKTAGNRLASLQGLPPEASYKALHGAWPPLQREVARLFAGYLVSAIEATRKHRAGGPPEGELNLTGAVSCLFGRQVSTVTAADFVKRILQFDETAQDKIFCEHPILREALRIASSHRPTKSKAKV